MINKSPTSRLKSRKGMSTVDVIIALCIAALALYLFAVNGTTAKYESEKNAMTVKAGELNMAMRDYARIKGYIAAQSAWTAAGSDGNRYLLLTPFISHPPASLDKYVLEGFTVTFPTTLRGGNVTLRDPSGGDLPY